MANVTITGLPAGTTPVGGTETLPADQSGVTVKLTIDQIIQRVAGVVLTGPIPVGNGGTGIVSGIAHGIVVAEGATAFKVITPGTSGYLLTSAGSGVDPTFTPNTLQALGIASGASGLVLTSAGTGTPFYAAVTPTLGAVSGSTFYGNPGSGVAVPSAFTIDTALTMLGIQIRPGGRLTLTSGSPVMTADVSGASGIYYSPYQTALIPIFDGTRFVYYSFPETLVAMTTGAHLPNNAYDVYGCISSGAPFFGIGPSWLAGAVTGTVNLRGTGAGSTAIQLLTGIQVNSNPITLRNGAALVSGVASGQATYLGSVAPAASGLTNMMFKPAAASGGSNNWLGLYNAYNQVTVVSVERDTTTWTYSSAIWRAANASNGNRVTFLDGLGQSRAVAKVSVFAAANNGVTPEIGVNFNSVTVTPSGVHGANSNNVGATSISSNLLAEDTFIGLGLNFSQAMEFVTGGTGGFTASSFYFNHSLLMAM